MLGVVIGPLLLLGLGALVWAVRSGRGSKWWRSSHPVVRRAAEMDGRMSAENASTEAEVEGRPSMVPGGLSWRGSRASHRLKEMRIDMERTATASEDCQYGAPSALPRRSLSSASPQAGKKPALSHHDSCEGADGVFSTESRLGGGPSTTRERAHSSMTFVPAVGWMKPAAAKKLGKKGYKGSREQANAMSRALEASQSKSTLTTERL